MVDTTDSKSVASNRVRVQVSFPVSRLSNFFRQSFFFLGRLPRRLRQASADSGRSIPGSVTLGAVFPKTSFLSSHHWLTPFATFHVPGAISNLHFRHNTNTIFLKLNCLCHNLTVNVFFPIDISNCPCNLFQRTNTSRRKTISNYSLFQNFISIII